MIEYGIDASGEKVELFFGPFGPNGYQAHYVFTIEGAKQYLVHLQHAVDRAIEIRNGQRRPGDVLVRAQVE